MSRLHHHILAELGLTSLYHSPIDAKVLILQRCIRFFAFGGSTIVLVLYLRALSISETRIGLFMSLALVGDVLSFVFTLFADVVGRKLVLGGGALLMTLSGVVFGVTGNYWLLLVVSVLGVISPTGREIGPFSAIEESTLAHLTPAPIRSDIFAWYTVIGSAGSSCGKLTTGRVLQHLQTLEGWDNIRAYRAVFFAYASLGLLNFVLACTLSKEIELKENETCKRDGEENRESEPLLDKGERGRRMKLAWGIIPKMSKESRAVIFKLCCLFALDSLASGLVPASWITYFFHEKFDLSTAALGSLFFTTGLLAALSSLLAASLSKRIGLVNTMVFMHLPSAVALAFIPVPSSLSWAIFFLVVRSSMASMDIAPKVAFLSAVVLPGERTAVMGFISVVRTASQSCGPVITGVLAQRGSWWLTFGLAGGLKVVYDLGLLAGFRGYKTHEDRAEERRKGKRTEEESDMGGEGDQRLIL